MCIRDRSDSASSGQRLNPQRGRPGHLILGFPNGSQDNTKTAYLMMTYSSWHLDRCGYMWFSPDVTTPILIPPHPAEKLPFRSGIAYSGRLLLAANPHIRWTS